MILTAEQLDRIGRDMTPAIGSEAYRLGYWHGFASRLCPDYSDADAMRDVQAGYRRGIRERVEWYTDTHREGGA